MAPLFELRNTSEESKSQAITKLLDNAAMDRSYFILLFGAILLAVGAIFTDSIPTLIASMLVAPLAYPILSLGLGLAAGNVRLAGRSLGLLVLSCAIALALGTGASAAFGNDRAPDLLISFNGNDYIAVGVAVVSGIIAACGITKPKVSAAAPGIAIAVSLMPPLVASGIGLAPGGVPLQGAPLLFGLNVLGIMLASAVVFKLTGMADAYRQHIRPKA